MPSGLNTYSDTLSGHSDSLSSLVAVSSSDSLMSGVEGVSRSHSLAFSSWTVWMLLFLTLLLFIIVYRKRQYILYRLRDFFSSEELFTFLKPQAVSNDFFTMTALLLMTCASLGLIVGGMSSLSPSVDEMVESGILSASGFKLSLKVGGLLLLFFVLKGILYGLINWVFFRHEQNVRWISSYFFLTGVFCFLLYPFSLIELFGGLSEKLLFLILLFLFISYEILLFYKLIVNFRAKKYGILLIFLYFCAVELLPALFLWQKIR